MTSWRNKIKAAVNAVVNNVTPIQPTLISEKSFKLVINILDNGPEAAMKSIKL